MTREYSVFIARATSLALLLAAAMLFIAAPMLCADNAAAFDPASYIPKDVVMAAVVDLSTSPDKAAAWDRVMSAAKGMGLEQHLPMLLGKLKIGVGFDPARDLLPRFIGTGAVALLPGMTEKTGNMIFVAGTKSAADSSAIMALISKTIEKSKQKIEERNYNGITYYWYAAKKANGICAGAVNGAILVATTESAFKKVVDTINGGPSLLQDENFTKQRLVNSKTLANVYISGSGLGEFMTACAAAVPGDPGQAAAGLGLVKNALAGYVCSVGNAEVSADGLTYSETGSLATALPELEKKNLDELVADVPRNAGIMLTINNWDDIWSLIKQQVSANPMYKSVVDQVVTGVKAGVGIDLFEDALDRITGIQVYYIARPMPKGGMPGQIAVVLTVDKPEVVRTTVKKFHDMLKASHAGIKDYSIAGQVVSADPTDRNLRYADTLVGNKAVFLLSGGYVLQEMRDKIFAARMGVKGLAAAPAFQQVRAQLPESTACLFYVDVASISKAFVGHMDSHGRMAFESILKTLSTLGSSLDMGGNSYQFRMAVPFVKSPSAKTNQQ